MRKLLFLCAFTLSGVAAVSAQTGAAYHFDNFDTRQGVRIETPKPAPQAKASTRSKKVRLTTRTAAAGEAGVGGQSTEAVHTRERGVSMAISQSLDGFSTGDRTVDEFIVQSGTRHGVDPVLLYAIMHRESSFKRHAVSHKGARGLMQLMPATAARFGVSNIFDPRQNIDAGARYMRFLLNFFGGDVSLALAGYNAGEGAVLKYGRRIPPYNETQEYVRRITQRYALMRDPQTARRAPVVTNRQVATIKAQEQAPPVYEQKVFAVRTPDGRLRLVSQ
jgi:soluble lytic murein transglycosylase-like protein